MSKLSEIVARDHKAFAFNIEDAMDSRSDRRYLLGLVRDMREVIDDLLDETGQTFGAEKTRALFAKLEE